MFMLAAILITADLNLEFHTQVGMPGVPVTKGTWV